MTIPLKYSLEAESAIASYNYTDIVAGTGIIVFYAGFASGAGAILSNSTFYGQPYESSYTTTTGYPVQADSMGFQINFNLPRVIKGDCIISAPIEVAGGGANQASANYHWSLYKVSGTTKTFLVSGASGLVASTGTKEDITTVSVNIPLTKFKKNDKLILSGVLLIGQNGGTGNFTAAYDPKNRAGVTITTIDTNLIANIPFRIDL